MTDEIAVATTEHPSITPTLKPTTPEDLLAMYDDIPEEPNGEIKKEDPKVETPVNDKISSVPQKEGEEEAAPETKIIKAKLDNNEVDIPEEATLSHTFPNGKTYDFKVADAVKAIVSQEEFNRNADRRINYIANREKNVETQVGAIVNNAKAITEAFVQGDVIAAVTAMARMAGTNSNTDPVQLQRKALDSLEQVFQVYSKLTPQQRELYFERQRSEEYKRAFESKNSEAQNHQQRSDLIQHVNTLIQKHGLTEDKFREYYHTLASNAVGKDKNFSSVEDIQPDDVINYHQAVKAVEKTYQAIANVEPALKEKAAFVDEVIKIVNNEPNLTLADVEEIIRIAKGPNSKAVENLNRKVDKASSNGFGTQFKKASSPKKAKESDLDKEMYNHFFGKRPVVRRT